MSGLKSTGPTDLVAVILDFSDQSKWTIKTGIPVLDEHELTDSNGRPEGQVDAAILHQIAANNNRRVRETGDPAPLIIGHTSDDPRAPERPVVGYAINYRVRPYKQGRQAIFVDYAIRKKYAHVIEDFPRRSVELWLNKRELDPIALLGGTTPERDLGVIVRNSRLKAVALLGATTPARDLGVTLKYSRRGKCDVLEYSLEDVNQDIHQEPLDNPRSPTHHPKRVNANEGRGATPARYAEGDDDGQSNEDQYSPEELARMNKPAEAAKRIAAAKRAKGSKDDDDLKGRRDRRKPPPFSKFGAGDHGMTPNRYGMGEPEGGMSDDDGADQDGDGLDQDGLDDEGDEGAGEDPMVAKVLASKPMRDMMDKVNQIFEAVTGGGDPSGMGGAGGAGGMGGGMDAPGGSSPMPGSGGAGGGGMDAPGGDQGMGGTHPDEEAAMFHGAPPVRFEEDDDMPDRYASGFGGPGSTYVPGTGGTGGKNGKRNKPSSRNGNKGGENVNGTRSRPAAYARGGNDRIRLQRLEADNRKLMLRLARADAEKQINLLKSQGIVFGDSPQECEKNEREEIEFLSEMDEQSQKWQLSRIRRLYRRAEQADPTGSQFGGVTRFSRNGATEASEGDDGEFNPETPQEAMVYAEKIQKLGPVEAVKYMRNKKNGVRR